MFIEMTDLPSVMINIYNFLLLSVFNTLIFYNIVYLICLIIFLLIIRFEFLVPVIVFIIISLAFCVHSAQLQPLEPVELLKCGWCG